MITPEKTYSTNPFVDNIIYYAKLMALNCTIKDEEEALSYETKESIRAADLLIACVEGKNSYDMFDFIPKEIISKYIDSISNLELYLNNELINNLKPEMEVSPDAVVRTKILEKYYKDGKTSDVLIDGNVDTNYIFEVASYDQYNNLAETLQEIVGIKVSKKGGAEITETTSETDQEIGYRKYSVPITIYGVYTVSTDNSWPQGLYLANESVFTVHPGAID